MAIQAIDIQSRLQMFGALRHRNFRLYWLGFIGQSAAVGMQFLILGWLVLELTNSVSQLGLVIFLYGIPNMSLLTFGGVLADRFDRRKLLMVSQSVVGTLIFVIATLTYFQLASIYHVYATAFILGVIQGINMPARLSIVSDLVDRESLLNATALSQSVMNTGRILGPSFAGLIIEYAGLGHALYVNSICYVSGLVFLLMMTGVSSRPVPKNKNVLLDIRDAIRFVKATPIVYTVIGMGFAFGFFGASYIQVLPAFGKEVLRLNAGGAGVMMSVTGVGSLVGSLTLASLGNVSYKNYLLLGLILLFGISLFIFAWSPWYTVSLGILFFVGMGFTGTISMFTTILQLTTPPELRGRIMSFLLISAALHFIGALPQGLVADYYSFQIAIAGGALIMLSIVIWIGVIRPTVRNFRI